MDEEIYDGRHMVSGRRKINNFIEDLVPSHAMKRDLDEAYRNMAKDEGREAEASEWSEALIGDAARELR
jgi:hypothetical protein